MLTTPDCSKKFPSEPLAIVGMACRLPGADDLDAFWTLMATGASGVREMPDDRMDRRLYLSSQCGEQSKTYSSISGLIPPRPTDPSADLRSIDREKLCWDPSHEILCGVVDAARSNAGWSAETMSGHRTGVYVGHSCGSSLGGELVLGSMIPEVAESVATIPEFQTLSESERYDILAEVVARIQRRRPVRSSDLPRLEAHFAAQFVARRFQLDGPQMVIDAACASSLMALVLAGAALAQGEIEQAVVSSASYSKTDSLILFSQAQSCSATGSRPFDAAADGLVNAEGYVVILIKTLSRALADGDTIQGVVRGIGISSDGRGRSLWAPRKEGQLEAVRRAYADDISPRSIQYLEAHATSTQVGDATELEALSAFFQDSAHDRKIPLGSVKSNLGHTLETAGLAGLLKCVLSMQRGLIPPTINLTHPNPAIGWSENPFVPVTTMMAWPDVTDQPRRAGINAFGIGGLNVHVVVDGPIDLDQPASISPTLSKNTHRDRDRQQDDQDAAKDKSVAVIGRGIIAPGAFDLNSFRQLLTSGESQLSSPPTERWRDTPLWESRPTIRHAYQHAKGGYVLGYKYDWRKHHIPPLQIEHANPLQFMLLDAAQQALDESGYGIRPFDRSRAAVVVGTLFGGDFSHQLQIGLRLPEIVDEFITTLRNRDWNEREIHQVCAAVQSQILTSYPAIKDQTGSFTCSTQASRIAKTLDIMGGALAIDAGDNSGLAALQAAQHLLATNVVDFVFCAAAQRDLDAAGFEAWNYQTGGSALSQNDRHGKGPAPGEGVVALLLRRLADANAHQDRIHGIIRDVRATSRDTVRSTLVSDHPSREAVASGVEKFVPSPELSSLTHQFGHWQGASGLLEILGATVRSEIDSESCGTTTFRTTTTAGEYQAVCEMKPNEINNQPTSESAVRSASKESSAPELSRPMTIRKSSAMTVSNGQHQIEARRSEPEDQPTQIYRMWGIDEFELRRRIVDLMAAPERPSDDGVSSGIPARAPYRLAIVSAPQHLRQKLKLLLDTLQPGQPSTRLQEQGIYYCVPLPEERPRMAALFPGQGSHRTGMLSDVIKSSESAAKMLQRADQALLRLGISECSPWITGEETLPGDDLQATQFAMLTADVCAFEAATEWGLNPDFLIGHSFGEYAALVSAGSLDFESAFAITLARSNAILGCPHGTGAMLSIAATLKEVRPLVAARTDIFVSHGNAPRQTVIAGTQQAVTELAARVKQLGIPAIQLPVGSPFHTPLLEAARPALQIALGQHRWRPPGIPVLSSVSGRFVSDRVEIIDNLSRQLIEPVYWTNYVERLLAEDVRVFVEVGPGRILTKITQQIIGNRNAFVVPMDDPSLSLHLQRQRIQAAMEAVGITSGILANQAASTTAFFRNTIPTPQIEFPAPLEPSVLRNHTDFSSTIGEGLSLKADAFATYRSDSGNDDALSQFLIDIIVEQTGYPPDIIEMQWDLEADLGIDSIRKVQILGELREYFDLETTWEATQIHELRTVNDLLELLRLSSGKRDWLQPIPTDLAPPEPTAADFGRLEETNAFHHNCRPTTNDVVAAIEPPSQEVSATASATADFLIDFVVEKTGYPRDVIDLDADLESDLGIDSIAKAQLIGEVRDHFQLPLPDAASRTVLLEIRTLRQTRDMIEESLRTRADGPLAISEEHGHESSLPNESTNEAIGHQPADAVPSETVKRESPSRRRDSENDEPVVPLAAVASAAFERGQSWGRTHRKTLRHQLFDFADRTEMTRLIAPTLSGISGWEALSFTEEAELRGVAVGANVSPENLLRLRNSWTFPLGEDEPLLESEQNAVSFDDDAVLAQERFEALEFPQIVFDQPLPELTRRFRLEMSPPEIRRWSGRAPDFSGGAIIVGDNSGCEELARRLKTFGVTVSLLPALGNREEAVAALDSIWKTTPSPHLFVLTPRDAQAAPTLDETAWKHRRESGITSLYWLCQKWLSLVEQSNLLDDASLIGVTALGGDFGVAHEISSAESGALAGLFKSILIECWVNGYRTVPIKLLDLPTNSPTSAVVDAICVELTEPSYDVEIGWDRHARTVLRATPEPIKEYSSHQLTPTGNWVVTGGARGITAYVVERMSDRFPTVHFHLVGTAPEPRLTDDDRHRAETDATALRADVMRRARKLGQSPLTAWKDFEKALEIDRSLNQFRATGLSVSYHSCDVANRSQLAEVLGNIRQKFGSIDGIIHGAGIGKDASFQRKEQSMVEQCLRAKIDGLLNLMALTERDPLQALIAFGSISGRFGANGHTDYSLANEMLAKLVHWQRQLRPTIPATVFHWHAWDNIGMATKPETRLALQSIGMHLMPAAEGAAHFLSEVEAGLPISEVLITDMRYYRMFYPADRIVLGSECAGGKTDGTSVGPLLERLSSGPDDSLAASAVLNPVADPFLSEHCLNGRPLLPMVMMAELLAEGAALAQNGSRPTSLRDLEILTSVKFPTDRPREMQVVSTRVSDDSVAAELTAEFYSRNGTLVSKDRLYAKAIVEFKSATSESEFDEMLDRQALRNLDWQPTQYPPQGSGFYVGGPLRCLRKHAINPENRRIWGRVSAPSLGELAGAARDISRWLTPSAVFDATLFASGILAWNCIRPGITLPQSAKRATFYRLPRPAEICWIRSQIVDVNQTRATFDITVWGNDRRPLLAVTGYVAAWLSS